MCHDLHFDLIQTPAARQQGIDNPSALDVFLTDSPQFFSKPSTIPSSSDHLIVGIQLNIKVSPSPQLLRTGRNYAKYSKAKMFLTSLCSMFYYMKTTQIKWPMKSFPSSIRDWT